MRYTFALLAVSLSCTMSCSKPGPDFSFLFQPKVILTQPSVENVPLYLTYPGYLQAYKTIELQSQIAGQLTGMYFEEGAEIKEGQVLFTIDGRPYQAALDKAEAMLKESIATCKYAEETVSRYSALVQDEYVSKLTYDQYVTNLIEAKSRVDASKADLVSAKLNLLYTTIYSPIPGIAGKKQIDVGNYIAVAESTPLIVINQIDPIYASFYVPDVDLPIIQKYQAQGPLTTQVYLNQNPDLKYEGKLTLIDNEVSASTATVFMRATLCNEAKILWPGEYIEVRLILKEVENAILLPSKAVQTGQEGSYVFVVGGDDIASIKKVKTGQRFGDRIVIEEGLSAEDRVVLEGQMSIYPGVKVIIEDSDNVPQAKDNATISIDVSAKEYLKQMRLEEKNLQILNDRGPL